MPKVRGHYVYYLGEEEITQLTTLQSKTGKVQKYEELVKAHSSTDPFVDNEFGHDNESVGNLETLFDAANPDGSFRSWTNRGWNGSVEWVRIKDIVKARVGELNGSEEVYFMSGKWNEALSRMDIQQGNLGDCWFLAAAGTVACEKELIEIVVPKDNENNKEAGIFHFNFWFQGFWIEIVVDDYLPCARLDGDKLELIGSSLVSGQNGKVEVWASFLEKAYAKLHGSYENISGNWPRYGFENLTGGAVESQIFDNPEIPIPKTLYDYLKANFGKNTLLALTCQKTNRGVYGGHAYSITSVAEVKTDSGETVKLIRIRNPWGSSEWEGGWKDPNQDENSRWNTVSENQKEALGLVNQDDGEFWMSYEDMITVFSELDICYFADKRTFERSDSKAKYIEHHGEWSLAQDTAVGANQRDKLPQYYMEVGSECESEKSLECVLIISIGLKQNINAEEEKLWGFYLYKVDQEPPYPEGFFTYVQPGVEDVSDQTWDGTAPETCLRVILKGYKLPKGKYVIVPYIELEGTEGRFYLRILYTK